MEKRSYSHIFLNSVCYNTMIALLTCISMVFASDNSVDITIGNDIDGLGSDIVENELLLFEDMPLVYSVSRSAQEIDDLSIPVNVITADDIHYSGFTSIPEALSYSLGVDILPSSRNEYRMCMEGIRFSFFDRTVTLINGRNVNSVVTGGTNYMAIPVFMEDIDRIEVVRGAGGAAWGTNAFNGVVNIVTKRPEDMLGFMYTGTFNEYGDSYNHFRWAEMKDSWQWRISSGYSAWTTTEDAVHNDDFTSNDFAAIRNLDSELIIGLSDLTELSFGAAWLRSRMGGRFQPTLATYFDPTAPFVDRVNKSEYQRYYAKLERKKYDDYSFYLQVYSNTTHLDELVGFRTRTMENDFEGQLDLDLDNHNLLVGINARQYKLESLSNQYSFQFNEKDYDDYQAGMFLIDRWSVSDNLDIEGQIRNDYFSNRDACDWSGRLSVIDHLDEEYNQKLRLSVARSFRAGSFGWKDTYFLDVRTDPEAKNEELVSYEAGYSIEPTGNIHLDLNSYYRKYKDLLGTSIAFDPLGGMSLYMSNNCDMDVLGVEAKLGLNYTKYSADFWMSYDDQKFYELATSTSSAYPANLKAGVNCRYELSSLWTASANFKYSGRTLDTRDEDYLDKYSLCTVAFTRKLNGGRGDLTFGVSNLFDDTCALWQNSDELDNSIGRTFFGRIQVKF